MVCSNCGNSKLQRIEESSQFKCPRCNTITIENTVVSKIAEKKPEPIIKKFNFEQSLKSVVLIKTENGTGTGFFITKDGHLITNSHVLEGQMFCHGTIGNSPLVYEFEVVSDGNVIGADLCLLKAVKQQVYQPIKFSENNAEVADKVYAIGNPKGLGLSLTSGTVSRLTEKKDLQMDITINPGNSGGPVMNEFGEVVGVVTYLLENVNGLGFAINKEVVKKFIADSNIELEG